jgi:hypothetical protein
MARQITITITYDMDDPDKTLADELQDWYDGNVDLRDLAVDETSKVTIAEG